MNILRAEDALNALYGAFSHLQKEGLPIRVEIIENIPLISCSDPKINYIISDFLSSFEKRIINTTLSINIRNYLQWADIFSKINKLLTDEEIKNFFMSELYFAFFYYDKLYRDESYVNKKVREEQYKPFLKQFKEKYGEQENKLWAVKVDNITRNGGSIAESMTRLIFTLYFRNRGYFVRGDIGRMMDMMVFDTLLLEKLRDRKLIGSGLIPVELLLNLAFGLVEKPKTTMSNNKYRFLAIEIESYSLRNGIKQLRDWVNPRKLEEIFGKYAQPFERAVVAIPIWHTEMEDIDILTYDENGIHYIECKGENIAQKEIINQEVVNEYCERLIKNTLYDFLPANYFINVIEKSLIGNLSQNIREEIHKASLDRILDMFFKAYFR